MPMANKLKDKPYRFSHQEDQIILNLFNWVSTDKLLILMKISRELIIGRYQHLTSGGK